MKRAVLLTFLPLLAGLAAFGQYAPQEQPAAEGFVTRVASGSDFDVNGMPVVCDVHTLSGWRNDATFVSGCPSKAPQLGESITVFGKLQKQSHAINATRIVQHAVTVGGKVSGEAVVDAPPVRNAPGFPAGTIMVRADGYWIILAFNAKITLWGSIKSVEDVNANTWIEYEGKMRPDGLVVASSVRLMQNGLSPRDERFRRKKHYDAATAAAAPRQSSVGLAIAGLNLKRVRPWPDGTMQARVEAIGDSLVPEYQKELPASDPAKLAFRFVVVDAKWGEFPVALPDGTILVPYKGVQRMQNDAQLAALLADALATVLEKQKLRMEVALRCINADELVSEAAYFAVAGLPGIAVWTIQEGAALRRETNQSGRVSLDLMHDAGYDVFQAPLAWWILAAGAKPISETQPPAPTIELYRTLAALWPQPQSTVRTP